MNATARLGLPLSAALLLTSAALVRGQAADAGPGAVPTPARQPAAGSPLTLPGAIEIALDRQPNLASSVANRQASEQRVKQRNASYYPSITPTYTYQSQYTYGTVNRFLGNGVVTQPQQGQSTTTRRKN